MGTSRLWIRLRASFWFTPAVIVVGSLVLAVLLVECELQRPVQRLRPRRDALALRRRLRRLQESLGEQGSREGTGYLSKESS